MVQSQIDTQTAQPTSHRFALLWRLLIALVVGGVAGAIIGLVIPRTYTATAVLQFPASAASPGGSTDKPELSLLQGVLSVPQPGTSPATAIHILNSHTVVSDLIDKYHIQPEWSLSAIDADTFFRRRFLCAAGTNGELQITYTDRKAERAKEVVGESIRMLTSTVENLSLDPAGWAVKRLAKNLHESEQACAHAEDALIRFLRAHGGVPPDTRLQGLNQLDTDLQRELRTAEVEQDAARAKMQSSTRLAEKMLAAAQTPAGGDPLLATLYRTVVEREDTLAVLRERFTDKRPEVVLARQAAEVAHRSLAAEITRQVRSLREGASPYAQTELTAVLAGQAKIDGLRRAVADIASRTAVLPAAQTQYEQLKLTLTDARTRLSLVRAEYVKAQIIAESRGPQFVVLDPPSIPAMPNEYSTRQFAFFGALLCGLLVLVIAAAGWVKAFMRRLGL